MRTIIASLIMSTLLLFIQSPVHAHSTTVPFTSITNSTYSATTNPAAVADFTCSLENKRVLLNWMVTNNQTADRLIIQRSKNGKKFEMVGLVFATDKSETDYYQFFEQLASVSKKSYYRIIIVRKDKSVEYSDTIHVTAGKKK